MAAKLDKETLAKHHFWILLGVLVPVVLIALIGLWGGAASAIDEKAKAITDAKGSLESTSAKGVGLLSGYDQQKEVLHTKRGNLWEEAWAYQKDVFIRPSPRDMPTLAVEKFGDEIPDRPDREFFQRKNSGYMKLYENVANSVRPTRFAGQQQPDDDGWMAVLQPVQQWNVFPSSEDVWLALEDYWIRAEVVRMIDSVNKSIGSFALISDPNDKLNRTFRSRLWEVEIKLVAEGDRRLLRGTLKNITKRRLQVGLDRTMTLRVYLRQGTLPPQPFDIPVEGDSVGAGQSLVFPPPIKQEDKDDILSKYELDEDSTPSEIAGLEQVFDLLTVPVKQINSISLAYPSNRIQQRLPLKMTAFSKKKTEPEEGEDDGFGSPADSYGEGEGDAGAYGGAPGGPGGAPGMFGPGGEGDGFGAQDAINYTENFLRRDRYIEVTKQVRRLPVATALVVDQAYVQDVLVAFTNSRLRFQTTQFHWERHPVDVMTFAMGGGTGSMGEGGEGGPTRGRGGFSPRPSGGRPGGGFSGMGGGRPGFSPRPGAGGPLGGRPGGRPGGPGMTPGGPGEDDGYSGMGPGSGANGATPERSLVELAIYGTMSIYNEYDPDASPDSEDESDDGF